MATITSSDSLKKFLDWSDDFLNFERTPKKNIFWLDTMKFFAEKLGSPETSFYSFHVAGSKGKGSVSCFIANILSEAGYKTGIYSSPHIIDFAERISLLNPYAQEVKSFCEEDYKRACEKLITTVLETPENELPGERPVTWFELVTLLSFLTMQSADCSWGVYETGLGGRLDATNILKPKASVITPIELEHTEYLGDTLEKIAAEKAGIIKEETPVFVAGQQTESVRDVFRKTAFERNAAIVFADECSKVSEIVFKSGLTTVRKSVKLTTERLLTEPSGTENATERSLSSLNSPNFVMNALISSDYFERPLNAELKLLGDFQAYNAALASIAVKSVLPEISEETIERGLNKASLPGRFEVLENPDGFSGIPALVLDGAHTPRSVKFTMETWEKFFSEYRGKGHLLFACAADKDVEHIAPLFKGHFASVTLTRPGETKASNLDRMEKAFSDADIKYELDFDWNLAIKKVFSRADKENVPVLVTGSFYLVSEVKNAL